MKANCCSVASPYLWAILFLCLTSFGNASSTAGQQNNNNVETATQTCLADSQNKDGTCQTQTTTAKAKNNTASTKKADAPPLSPPLECGLFLAPSSIPNSGWGMYTGIDLKNGQVIPPVDVVIPNIDTELHRTQLVHYNRLKQTMGSHIGWTKHGRTGFPPNKLNASRGLKPAPKWLMEQYYWDATMTHNWYDAEKIDSVVPGLGMLANSHPGMILADNDGPKRPPIIGGRGNGARTPYQDQSFLALSDIPAGHELFVEYGDSWFEERFDKSFGLSNDYARGNILVEQWQRKILTPHRERYTNVSMWRDLEDLLLDVIEPLDARLHEVLARLDLVHKNDDYASKRFVAKDNPTAYAATPKAHSTVEWLQQEGMCLDHITVGESLVAPGERGAFASRFLPKGTMVAPAPVVHMSRDHLTMLLLDQHDSDIVLWHGYQLLLNYVYGHEESSLLFFPYSPSANLINHYTALWKRHDKATMRPNVKLQWSAKMPHPEWLESWTPDQVLEQSYKAGLVMEIIALEDIPQGAEIVMDYGDAWEAAFEEHKRTTPPPPVLPSVEWDHYNLLTINDEQKYPPIIETVCWIHVSQQPHRVYQQVRKQNGGKMPEQWIAWKKINPHFLSDTLSCTVVGRFDGNAYNVIVKDTIEQPNGQEKDIEVRITNIPRKAITIVPLIYTNAELRRDSFRKEIQLPEDMVPDHWRDLKDVGGDEGSQCHLFMAESSVPNAGWGIYRGHATPLHANQTNDLDHFCEDMVIQVEDFALNQVLRNRYNKQTPDPEMDDWLLSRYAWKGDVTKGGNLEAENVQSFSPGCGMMANAYPLLYNAHKMPPMRLPVNTTDPSLGATTHYHSGRFVEQYLKQGKSKIRTLQNGNEIIVKADDQWLKSHEDVTGKIPSRPEFAAADKVLKRFQNLKQAHGKEATDLVWKLLWNTIEAFQLDSFASVVPQNAEDIKEVLESGGTARHQLRNRVRTPEWLEEHGSCVDNIRPGPSTIDLAGNGAFATRNLAKDTVIAALPLVHVHRQHMDIYDSEDIRDPRKPVFKAGKQLLMNYVYGHPQSNLLLMPYSPVVNYINHAHGSSANAKLQWSSKFNSDEWLEKTPEELLRHHKTAGLAFEIVAARDIAAGEEITLDYGPDWESAWKHHTENWEFDRRWNYEPPANDWLSWMPTEDEIERQNVLYQFQRPDKFLGCHVQLPSVPVPPVYDESAVLPEYEWTPIDGMFRTTSHVYPCEVIERSIESDNFHYSLIRKDSVAPIPEVYSAVVTVDPGNEKTPPRQFISFNMPRRAIEVFDEEYSSPQFYKGAFRHPIGIPDDIFPEAWRDLKA